MTVMMMTHDGDNGSDDNDDDSGDVDDSDDDDCHDGDSGNDDDDDRDDSGDDDDDVCSIHNTVYLEVHCPVVKPELVVISDNGSTVVDFGDVSIGQHTSRSITIQNISERTVEVCVLCVWVLLLGTLWIMETLKCWKYGRSVESMEEVSWS